MAADSAVAKPDRRRARLERELKALRTMDGHLRWREMIWPLLTIPFVAVLVMGIAIKTHLASDSPLLAIVAALASGALVWWIGRRWLSLAVLIVLGLLLILFEELPDPGFGDFGGGATTAKQQRRLKLDRAIARREALLAQLGGNRP